MGEVKVVPGMTEDDLRQVVLTEITAICGPLTSVCEDEVTISDMATIWDYSASTTQTLLDRRVNEGYLSRRKALSLETGRECWAYRVQDVKDS